MGKIGFIFLNFFILTSSSGSFNHAFNKVINKLTNIYFDIKIFDKNYSSVYLCSHGYVAFSKNINFCNKFNKNILSNHLLIAPFWSDKEISYKSIGYSVDKENKAADDIRNSFYGFNSFNSSSSLIITWKWGTYFNVIELIITTNGSHSFAIFNYNLLVNFFDSQNKFAGFNTGNGLNYNIFESSCLKHKKNLSSCSNIGIPGKYIFRVDSLLQTKNTIFSYSDRFYPFGSRNENFDANNDNGYQFKFLNYFKYFNQLFDSITIKSGLVYFGNDYSIIFPRYNNYVLAPFYLPDHVSNQKIYLREVTNSEIVNRISNDVQNVDINFRATWAIIITWYSLMNNQSLKNTYQLTLTTNGTKSFAIFNYISLSWYRFGESTSRAFYDTGNGKDYFFFKGSYSKDILKLSIDSNVKIPGLWIFELDSEVLQSKK
jgi:hypothetical protein